MADVILEWAGKSRLFRLDFGRILDLQEAVDAGIGAIYLRIGRGDWRVDDVYHIIRLGLIGGGKEPVKAKLLMQKHFDTRPLLENHQVALEIILTVMAGVEPSDEPEPDNAPPVEDARLAFSEAAQICQVFNMSPGELRRLSYADFVNLMRGYAAANKDRSKPEFPTEEEFEDILARYEPED